MIQPHAVFLVAEVRFNHSSQSICPPQRLVLGSAEAKVSLQQKHTGLDVGCEGGGRWYLGGGGERGALRLHPLQVSPPPCSLFIARLFSCEPMHSHSENLQRR